MPLPAEFAGVFQCPKCRSKVVLRADESGFECAACRLLFPIVDGLPDFLIEDAQPL